METFLQDLRHSLRMFWQSRGFTAAAIAALALGIGSNTAIFSIVNTVLLRPPHFPQPDRIVVFENVNTDGKFQGASPAKFAHWRAQSDVVELVSVSRTNTVTWTGNDTPEQLKAGQVSADYFQLFGAKIIAGRSFSPDEDLPKGPHVAVISESLWNRRFARDPQVTSKSIQLGGEPHAIVGVVSGDFDVRDFGDQPEIWIPFQLDPNSSDQGHYFGASGRLKAGVTLQQAQAKLKLSAEDYRRKFPAALQNNQYFSVETIHEALVADYRSSLLILVGAVAMVLLIACANVANLLLARAIGRRREIAIRAALGAARGRIVRQLLTESFLLSAAGAIVGTALGFAGIRALLLVNTAGLPRVGENGGLVSLDWRVLAFTAVITLVTSILFGLFPALQVSRVELANTLKEAGSRSGSGLRQNKARSALVVVEIALAVVLLTGAALLIRTSMALASVKPGYQTENVLTLRMSLAGKRYVTSNAIENLVRDGTERVRALPGVVAASATCCVPLEGGYGLPFLIVGRALERPPFHGGGGWRTVSPGFFDVFQIPVVKGRAFNERDNQAGQPVVVISQSMAKRFWPNSDPLNDKIWIGKGVMSELATEQPRQIVGIVGDVRDGGLNRDPGSIMYIPNAQVPDALNALNTSITPIAWVVRTSNDPMSLSPAIQEQLRQASGLPFGDIRSMRDIVARSTSRERFNMLLMSVFAGAALLLAAIGVYGLMAYSVQQRTQEIGIRLALGAETGAVRRMVIWQGMIFALAGVGIGAGAAFALARFIRTFLYGVEPSDPLVFLTVPVLLALTALAAVWIPAVRATRINPIEALRYE
ncbi:MAG TPA: ABC transporter permease [Bryobacteraceae bacterium]|nr:ABC transporter permease [Bryobacteraceae bacterium]